jgi:nitrate reductase assembly molybdenum cofactor insertion protein NarJ
MARESSAGVPLGVADALAGASAWMFASIALQPPSAASMARLEALLPSLPAELRSLAARVAALPLDQWEPEYFSVLGPAGCPVCESSYERAAQASRGPALADVSGCYRAFAFMPDVLEVPDHAAVESAFLGYLALKIAFAVHDGDVEAARITFEAYDDFRSERVAQWFGDLTAALTATGSPEVSLLTELLDATVATTGVGGASDSK